MNICIKLRSRLMHVYYKSFILNAADCKTGIKMKETVYEAIGVPLIFLSCGKSRFLHAIKTCTTFDLYYIEMIFAVFAFMSGLQSHFYINFHVMCNK